MDSDIPAELRKYVTVTSTGVTVTGDATASRDVHVWATETDAWVSTDLASLIQEITARGHQVKVSAFGISALLFSGLVPVPHTVYEGLYRLSYGDQLDFTATAGSLDIASSFDYPWIDAKSREDEVADEARLLELLVKATERQLAPVGNQGFLMLSSGKDSPSVALALAEGGFTDVSTLTYRSHPEDPESPIAARIARTLGLKHEIVDLPTSPDVIRKQLTTFFESAPEPGVDLAQIPYVAATMSVGAAKGAVLDGGGNDSYTNHSPGSRSRVKLRYRVRPAGAARMLRRVLPLDSRLNYLTRSRQEMGFSGRLMQERHIDRLYRGAVDMGRYWEEESAKTAHLDQPDEWDMVLRRQIHPGQVLLKQKLAAQAIGLDALLPWCDDDVANYYFNMRGVDRYGPDGTRDKLLIRKMLLRYVDLDSDAVGKHYFVFDGAEFVAQNADFVREEIEASPLWDPDGKAMMLSWLDQLPRRPMLHHAILTVFMISGWSNHYPAATQAIR